MYLRTIRGKRRDGHTGIKVERSLSLCRRARRPFSAKAIDLGHSRCQQFQCGASPRLDVVRVPRLTELARGDLQGLRQHLLDIGRMVDTLGHATGSARTIVALYASRFSRSRSRS